MRQAIETKFLGPTNSRGARIRVKAQAGRMTVPWDHAFDPQENHYAAALAFAGKRGWYGRISGGTWPPGRWVGGAKADDTGYVFVWVEE